MAVITPQSDVYLLKVPLEIDNENQLTFANAEAQYDYFKSLPKVGFDDFTYIRKESVLRIPALIDNLYNYNYVMYRNDAYSNKWFYAYITGMTYMNDNVTDVSIATDTFQTWQFELNYKKTFVEREHVNDDTAGLHTIPEGLELGEYEIVDLRNSPLWESDDPPTPATDWLPCFCVTAFPPNKTSNLQANGRAQGDNGYVGGVYSTLHFIVPLNLAGADYIIKAYEDDIDITTDAIINIFMVPRCCVHYLSNNFTTIDGTEIGVLYNYYVSNEYQLQQPNVLAENYTPVNKKLLSYPFSYFYLSNNNGEDIIYHYEDFPIENVSGNTARTMTYKKAIVPSTSLSAKLYFTKYKSYTEQAGYGTKMYQYGITYAKVPVCAWTTDYYTNWLTQNGINVGASTIGGVAGGLLGVAGGIAFANPIAMVSGGLSIASTIANTIGETHKAEAIPPQANGDINTGDFNFNFLRNSISIYEMSIRPEMAKIIDAYFSAYGYKVNEVKVPNITGRRNWNYVKTIGCYIEADIPQEDLQQIKDLFNKGITFWHNPATFADYSQNNDII